jgi:hypothetical protein
MPEEFCPWSKIAGGSIMPKDQKQGSSAMATLYLMRSLPGSGKTTIAKQIEALQSVLRLCPDEWIESLLADHVDSAELNRFRITRNICCARGST